MSRLWAAGQPQTVRQVCERLSPERELAYTTVLTTLRRLARKGLVKQERIERAHRYSAVTDRGTLFAEMITDALGVVDGDPGAFVQFVHELNEQDRDALRKALNDNPSELGAEPPHPTHLSNSCQRGSNIWGHSSFLSCLEYSST